MCISLIHFSFIISFLPLLRALTPIIHPTLTYLLLEVTTRVLLLYNSMNSSFGGSGGGSNPIHATITTANETYQLSQPVVKSIVDNSLITGILGCVYRIWLIYAVGLQYLLIAIVFFTLGIPVFCWSRKEFNIGQLKQYEKIIMIIIVLVSIFAIYAFARGIIKL